MKNIKHKNKELLQQIKDAKPARLLQKASLADLQHGNTQAVPHLRVPPTLQGI